LAQSSESQTDSDENPSSAQNLNFHHFNFDTGPISSQLTDYFPKIINHIEHSDIEVDGRDVLEIDLGRFSISRSPPTGADCAHYFVTHKIGNPIDPGEGIEFGVLVTDLNSAKTTYFFTHTFGHGCNADIESDANGHKFFLSSFIKIRTEELLISQSYNNQVEFEIIPRKRPL